VPTIATMTNQSSARDVLTQAEAEQRARRVGQADYELRLDLLAGSSSYRGDLTLRFAVSGDGPLFIDFRGRRIDLLEVNGRQLVPEWTGYRLKLPATAIDEQMTVRVVYENDFDTTGDGFHRFVDPEDGEEYLYTNFEPYEAHRLFPCFDQPDIKGRYRVSLVAPAGWLALANAPLQASSETADGRVLHEFAESELFSTYLMAVACGPYASQYRQHGDLRLGVHARRSMEGYLVEQAPEILEVTAQGMDFYSDLFDRAYPFAKYDQIFVPEYNSGAMENVGLVTYNEAYLFRDPPTNDQRLDRAEVLLHELTHMWFGNLVTMRWWDDLWLNESFATYLAYLGLTEATRFTEAWKAFNADMKRWAYQQDQLGTTHPIAGNAADTEIAFLNFDGITYGKGAAALKQLVKAIGREAFRDGLRLYFRRHAWGNATLRDFLACLEESSGRSLAEWARLWLETPSLNTLAVEWRADGDRIADLCVRQSAPEEHPYLRPHAFDIGLAREDGGRLVIDTLPVALDGAEHLVSAAIGLPAPEFVFANHGDHAYAKVILDQASLAYVRQRLHRVDDALLRELLWMSLWEMVRDCQLRSTDFVQICREQLPRESDSDILSLVLDRLTVAVARYLPDDRLLSEAHACFLTAIDNLAAAAANDGRILWARSAIAVAANRADVEQLVEMVDDGRIGDFSFDQEMRWGICIKAAAHGLPIADEWLEREASRDGSDRGRRAVLTATAARPDAASKSEAWRRIHGEGYGSFHLTRAAMQGFFWRHQADLVEPYVPRFFEQVRDVFATRDHPFARSYLAAMYPAYRADSAVLDRSRRLLAELDGSLPTLTRQLTEAAEELERAIAVRAAAAG
jgi:aminopeptidase N